MAFLAHAEIKISEPSHENRHFDYESLKQVFNLFDFALNYIHCTCFYLGWIKKK